jgi:hypothetical protein
MRRLAVRALKIQKLNHGDPGIARAHRRGTIGLRVFDDELFRRCVGNIRFVLRVPERLYGWKRETLPRRHNKRPDYERANERPEKNPDIFLVHGFFDEKYARYAGIIPRQQVPCTGYTARAML